MSYGIAIYVVAFVGFAVGWLTGVVCFSLLASRPADDDQDGI